MVDYSLFNNKGLDLSSADNTTFSDLSGDDLEKFKSELFENFKKTYKKRKKTKTPRHIIKTKNRKKNKISKMSRKKNRKKK